MATGAQQDPRLGAHAQRTASAFIVDASEASFQDDVIEASFTMPVVVDLWAPWCGPCKTLSPVLEGLAQAGEGQWRLVKVNVDEAPNLAAYFQAQSIPLVLAIYQGALVAKFSGALPKAQIEGWIGDVFKRCGLTLEAAEVAEAPKEPAAAEAFYRARVAKRPDEAAAKVALGRLLFARGAVEEATAVLQAIPVGAAEYSAAQAALGLKELLAEVGEAGGADAVVARGAEDADGAYLVALVDGTSGRFATALERLVGQIGQPSAVVNAEQKTRAKKAAALLLEAAGRSDPEVEYQRKRLTRLLF